MALTQQLIRLVPGRVRRWNLRRQLEFDHRPDMLRLGSGYGGWWIPASLIGADSICYCAGVGEDATFDWALIDSFGCTVHAFDPTPAAQSYVASVSNLAPEFVFHPYGVWSEDTTLKFYVPRNPEADISHSAVNLQGTESYFEWSVRSICSIMESLNHDHIDLLKLDIEGAEHEVLRHLTSEDIWPRILCVEFDQPCSLKTIRAQTELLSIHGYAIVKSEKWNFTFVREI